MCPLIFLSAIVLRATDHMKVMNKRVGGVGRCPQPFVKTSILTKKFGPLCPKTVWDLTAILLLCDIGWFVPKMF